MDNNKVSIIIPTFNERNYISPLIERIDKSIKDFDHEIIIVDNSSPDGTAQTVEELSKKYKPESIKLVVRKNEKGLAKAVVEGFKHASGDIYAVMLATDLKSSDELVPLIWETCNGTDIAIASLKGVRFGGFKRNLNKIAKLLMPKLENVNDLQSGFFTLKKDVIKNVELKPVGYEILFEILALGNYKVVKEVSYQCPKENKENKLGTIVITDYLYHIASLAFREKESKRLMKFMLTGLAGIVFSIATLWFLTDMVGIYYILSGLISKEIGIFLAFVANEFWVFNDRIKFNLKDSAKRCLQFNINRSVSMVVVLVTMAILTEFLVIHYIISNLIGILIAFPLNYVVSNKMIWTENKIHTDI